ncbi:MAG: carbohydrate kinase family protein [Candidatus Adiutrix sp.]|jgi:adenosine kinase|nr:carbohydrate kinase family protein [Candidatus Adiutrix sp.]
MSLICSGSLAFDRLMTYPGLYAESFLPDKLDLINLSFLVDKVERAYGGTAGNIAYNLGLLGEKPLIAASLGEDPEGEDYRRRLAGFGFSLEAVASQSGQLTAGCTIATDRNNNQLTFFHPGAMLLPSGFQPADLPRPHDRHLAIVSAGGLTEMKSLCAEFRRLEIKFIFDGGQQIHAFSGRELIDMLEGSFIFVCNEYEFELFKRISGLKEEELFRYTETVIVTLGEKGGRLLTAGRGSQHLSPVPARRVVNPTGAGDAFRAGLMKGLYRGWHLISACRLGATVASFCVEVEGTQDQSFTLNEVAARHAAAFKEQLNF